MDLSDTVLLVGGKQKHIACVESVLLFFYGVDSFPRKENGKLALRMVMCAVRTLLRGKDRMIRSNPS